MADVRVSAWSPSNEGWEAQDFDDDPRQAQSFTGFFEFIRLNVMLYRGERPQFMAEVD